jgi:hypothetical protein
MISSQILFTCSFASIRSGSYPAEAIPLEPAGDVSGGQQRGPHAGSQMSRFETTFKRRFSHTPTTDGARAMFARRRPYIPRPLQTEPPEPAEPDPGSRNNASKPRRKSLPRATTTACRSSTLLALSPANRSLNRRSGRPPRQDKPLPRDGAARAIGECRPPVSA